MGTAVLLMLAALVWEGCGQRSPATEAAKCEPSSTGGCGFYDCVERAMQCQRGRPQDSYPLLYGKKYCLRFAAMSRQKLGSDGMRWRDATLTCLQKKLHYFISRNPSANCQQLTRAAFDSHPACYTNPVKSICALDLRVQTQIGLTVDTPDLVSTRSGIQVAAVAKRCAKDLVKKVARHVPGGTEALQRAARNEHVQDARSFANQAFDKGMNAVRGVNKAIDSNPHSRWAANHVKKTVVSAIDGTKWAVGNIVHAGRDAINTARSVVSPKGIHSNPHSQLAANHVKKTVVSAIDGTKWAVGNIVHAGGDAINTARSVVSSARHFSCKELHIGC